MNYLAKFLFTCLDLLDFLRGTHGKKCKLSLLGIFITPVIDVSYLAKMQICIKRHQVLVYFCKCKITYLSKKIEKAKRKRRPKKRPKTTNTLSDLSSDSNTDYEEESEIGKNILQKETFSCATWHSLNVDMCHHTHNVVSTL